MKELNYDEVVAPPKLKITIDKKKYEEPQPSLKQIIDYEQRVKELEEGYEKGIPCSEAGDKWIDVIRSIFCSIPREVLRTLSLPLLKNITADCTKFMQESMFADAPVEENTKGDIKKK